MASTIKFKMGDLLNMLALPKATLGHVAKPPEAKRDRRRTTIYLNHTAPKTLDCLVREGCTSQTDIVNAAIVFYAERDSHIEKLIKKSIQEAFREFKPATTRRRVLVRRIGPCTE